MMTESQEQGQDPDQGNGVEVELITALARQYQRPLIVQPGMENVIILAPSYLPDERGENGEAVMKLEMVASIAGLTGSSDAEYLRGVATLLRGFAEDIAQAAEQRAEGEGDAQSDCSR